MVKKCINNHFYDGSRFEQCPYCGAKDMNARNETSEDDVTMPIGFQRPRQEISQPVPQSVPQPEVKQPEPQDLSAAFSADDDDDATIPLAFYKRKTEASPEPQQNTAPEPKQPETAPEPKQPENEPVRNEAAKQNISEAPVEIGTEDEIDKTIPMEQPSAPVIFAEAVTEPKPVTEEKNDIAVLVAEAMADDKQAAPDVTEQPSAEEIASADAAMQQEQAAADQNTAQNVTEQFASADAAVQQEQAAADQNTVQNVTEQLGQMGYTSAEQNADVQQPMAQQPAYTQQPFYGQPMMPQYPSALPMQPVYNGYGYQQPAPVPAAPENNASAAQPVVGWLVGLNGLYRGRIFELKAGRNFIGRSPDMEIMLSDDNAVSFSRHASVIYEPNTRVFIAQAGESNGLVYVNGEMVLNSRQLSVYDKVTVGNTKLLFFPLCSEGFAWEDLDGQD